MSIQPFSEDVGWNDTLQTHSAVPLHALPLTLFAAFPGKAKERMTTIISLLSSVVYNLQHNASSAFKEQHKYSYNSSGKAQPYFPFI